MLEESIPAIWTTMNSWFTPTVLFIFLNLMIGTIAVASGGFGNQNKSQQQNDEQQKRPLLARSPSRLERLKSMNFYRFRSEESNPFPSITTTILNQPLEPETHHIQEQIPTQTQTQTQTQEPEEEEEAAHEEKSFGEVYNQEKSLDEIFHQGKSIDEIFEHHVVRTTSDTNPASGFLPKKLPQKMKKSASTKSPFSHFEEDDIVEPEPPRPATVREGKKKSGDFGDDEEVDAKADDFINKFKQQLKLQRLDSILRYKETLKRN